MKISAQEEYGLRCLLQLARLNEDGWVTVSQIAENEGLSVPYVEKLLRILSKDGLVESARGSRGGYRLGLPENRITVGAALRALGAFPDSNNVCGQYVGNMDTCVHSSGCSVRPVWAQIILYMGAMLDGLTLADLLGTETSVRERVAVAHTATVAAKTPLIRGTSLRTNSRLRSMKEQ